MVRRGGEEGIGKAVGVARRAANPTPLAARRSRVPAQQWIEAGLPVMMIVCQRAGDSVFMHDVEGDAIGQGPCFVGALLM